MHTLLLYFHIAAGTLSILAGALALLFRKGSARHKSAGRVFVVAMFSMTISGGIIAFLMPVSISVIAAVLTFYLVATALLVLRRSPKQTGLAEIIGMLVVACLSVSAFYYGELAAASEAGFIQGIKIPVAAYYVFSVLCAVCAVSDLRYILIGGLAGAQRIAAHLWRMGLAMYIATSSLFTGQPQRFPAWLEESGVLSIPENVVLLLLLFWFLKTLMWPPIKRTIDKLFPRLVRSRA